MIFCRESERISGWGQCYVVCGHRSNTRTFKGSSLFSSLALRRRRRRLYTCPFSTGHFLISDYSSVFSTRLHWLLFVQLPSSFISRRDSTLSLRDFCLLFLRRTRQPRPCHCGLWLGRGFQRTELSIINPELATAKSCNLLGPSGVFLCIFLFQLTKTG